jgi:hypothetical protein
VTLFILCILIEFISAFMTPTNALLYSDIQAESYIMMVSSHPQGAPYQDLKLTKIQ